MRKGSPQPLAHFNIGFASFFALVWAISTTAKALSAYATREVVSRMYRWRCPKGGIGARLHAKPLRAVRTARRRQKLVRIPPPALVQRSREGQARDRARMLGSKHGCSRQNGIAEVASGHVEFTDARPSLELWRPHWIIVHRYTYGTYGIIPVLRNAACGVREPAAKAPGGRAARQQSITALPFDAQSRSGSGRST